MILQLVQGTESIALRLKSPGNTGQIINSEDLQLLIHPSKNNGCCSTMGSPLYFHGCWPVHRTGVDTADYTNDFPTLVFDSVGVDLEGRIIFDLDDNFQKLTPGRYGAAVRVKPPEIPPELPENVVIKGGFPSSNMASFSTISGDLQGGCLVFNNPYKHEAYTITPPACVLARFEISVEHPCMEHYIDQIAVVITPTPEEMADV